VKPDMRGPTRQAGRAIDEDRHGRRRKIVTFLIWRDTGAFDITVRAFE